jgi:hypothetical protein
MPKIIDYPTVLDRLTKQGLKSLYHNSGAFGFSDGIKTVSRGWIGPEDASIRESARAMVRKISEPYAERMTELMLGLWLECLPGAVWIMPKSHWSYELEFGSRDWLPGGLEQIGIDATSLAPLNHAPAIEFVEREKQQLGFFVQKLLTQLVGSDFQLVFPGHDTICTIHTRTQLWWTTSNLTVANKLDLNEDA